MKNKIRRKISLILALSLVLGMMIPMTVYAENEATAEASQEANQADLARPEIRENGNKDIEIAVPAGDQVTGIKASYMRLNSTVETEVWSMKSGNEWKLDRNRKKGASIAEDGTITISGAEIQGESMVRAKAVFTGNRESEEVIFQTGKKLDYKILKELVELNENVAVEDGLQLIEANSPTAKIISDPKNGIQIDEKGFLHGTPVGLSWQKGEKVKEFRLDFTVEDGTDKIRGRQIRVSVKREDFKYTINQPQPVTEGEAVQQANIISTNRPEAWISSGIQNGLEITGRGNGTLSGTPKDLVWEENITEKQVSIPVTIDYDGQEIKETVTVVVKKAKPNLPPSNPEPSNPEPSNPGPSNPGPSNPGPSNPGPGGPAPGKPAQQNPKTEIVKTDMKKEDKKPEVISEKNEKSYISGYPDGSIRPNAEVTRAEVMAMISKFKGYDVTDNSQPKFTDTQDAWYNKFINAVVKAGLSKGYEDGSFKPENPITRAEFVHLLIQLYQTADYMPVEPSFTDVDQNHWAKHSIDRAYQVGLIKGYEDKTFRPDQTLSRAEAVVILNRLTGKTLQEKDKAALDQIALSKQFIDLDKSHWAYYEILRATEQ
ncbi:S-layer homology domain-containing protein [Clostridiales bacterium COT073_COT-073]|nr:S-layer homology domain-containing protein [Clostridiales bacterium COT073_COT-073]